MEVTFLSAESKNDGKEINHRDRNKENLYKLNEFISIVPNIVPPVPPVVQINKAGRRFKISNVQNSV